MATARTCISYRAGLALALVCLLAAPVLPVAPRPSEDRSIAPPTAAGSSFLQRLPELHRMGVCTADSFFLPQTDAARSRAKTSAATTFRILALLVDFSDHAASTPATYFDSMIFSTAGSTVHNYFSEVSYTQLDLITVNLPSANGWFRAPQTYAYYVNGQQGLGGTYNQSARGLVSTLVNLADPVVDYSQYDNDGDGDLDVLLVVHSGTGAEYSASMNDIWSHKWNITPTNKDGVIISAYTIQPEFWANSGDMTIGVYSHELAHGFGLPDLYDTDGSSAGVGRFCLMAYGSWNGPGGLGGSPSHPCAWSRIQMGFATPTVPVSNLMKHAIPNVEQSGAIYKLWSSGAPGSEYFLVENRRLIGSDAYLPSQGLMIWHVDDTRWGAGDNDNEWYPPLNPTQHYLVALEQADGLYDLDKDANTGNGGDPFPGATTNRSFNGLSSPNSNSYTGGPTTVAVSNITNSADTMRADLLVTIVAGVDDPPAALPTTIALAQNYPNPFNPGTVIGFELDRNANVRLEIFNLLGQKVRTLHDGTAVSGSTTVAWDATDDRGEAVASGMYFYRLTAGDQVQVKKMMLTR